MRTTATQRARADFKAAAEASLDLSTTTPGILPTRVDQWTGIFRELAAKPNTQLPAYSVYCVPGRTGAGAVFGVYAFLSVALAVAEAKQQLAIDNAQHRGRADDPAEGRELLALRHEEMAALKEAGKAALDAFVSRRRQ